MGTDYGATAAHWHAIGALVGNRPADARDVLQTLLTQELEVAVQLALKVIVGGARDQHPPGGQSSSR
jgi:hypothetical protein